MPRARRSSGVNVSFFAFQDIITAVTGILILIVIVLVLMLQQPGTVDVPIPEVDKRTLAELELLIEEALVKIKRFATINFTTGNETVEKIKTEIESIQEELGKEEDLARLALLQKVEKTEMERDQARESVESLMKAKAKAEELVSELETTLEERLEFVRENAEQEQVWIQYSESEKEPVIIELGSRGGVLRDLHTPEFKKSFASTNLEREIRSLTGTVDSEESYFVFFIRPSGIAAFRPIREILREEGFDLGYRPLGEKEELKILGPETLEFEP
jgi:hypothetical protein